MTRLTNEMREDIIYDAIGSKFTEQVAQLDLEEQELAEKIYLWALGDTIEILRAMPDSWCLHNSKLYISIAGDYTHISLSEIKKLPNTRGAVFCKVPLEHRFSADWLDLKRRRRCLAEEETKLRNTLKELLLSVKTDTQLYKLWPEIKPVAQEVIESCMPAPIVVRADFNKLNNTLFGDRK